MCQRLRLSILHFLFQILQPAKHHIVYQMSQHTVESLICRDLAIP